MTPEYERVAKATLKIGRGYDEWNTDEGVTVHAVARGLTACGVLIGPFKRGWLTGSWMRRLDVTCKRCLRSLERESRDNDPLMAPPF